MTTAIAILLIVWVVIPLAVLSVTALMRATAGPRRRLSGIVQAAVWAVASIHSVSRNAIGIAHEPDVET